MINSLEEFRIKQVPGRSSYLTNLDLFIATKIDRHQAQIKLIVTCLLWSEDILNVVNAFIHTTLKTPVLVRSPNLSSVNASQYLDGWPPVNTSYCSEDDNIYAPYLGDDLSRKGLLVATHVMQSSSNKVSSPVAVKLIWGARGVMVIVVGNGHGDTSSNPGRGWLHFT